MQPAAYAHLLAYLQPRNLRAISHILIRLRTGVSMHLSELQSLHVSEVFKQAKPLKLKIQDACKHRIDVAIIKKAKAGEQVFADGVLEVLNGFGFLRGHRVNASTDDITVPSQMGFNLHGRHD